MKQILSELMRDHRHISAVLTILKNKLAMLEDRGRPDFNLMSEVIDYLEDYADGYHHVREDLIFGYMRDHYQQCESLVDQAAKEHQQLAQLTQTLRESVDQVLIDAPFLMEDFTALLHRFIDKQAQHLAFEENKLFPLIAKQMTEQDWQQFSRVAPVRQDPLASSQRDERYRQLYNALIDDLR
ncbi:MAG: hemerythrin domain-containing protein [Motiliproteus sp.]